ncbi:hypothetical protein AZ23_1254, partial [Bordetella bronchiseptica E010]
MTSPNAAISNQVRGRRISVPASAPSRRAAGVSARQRQA